MLCTGKGRNAKLELIFNIENNFKMVTWHFYEGLKLLPSHHLPQLQLLPQQVADQGFLAFQQPYEEKTKFKSKNEKWLYIITLTYDT